MDIPTLAMNTAHTKLMQDVQTGMMKKAIDQMEQTGEQLVALMDAAEIPADGIIDIKM